RRGHSRPRAVLSGFRTRTLLRQVEEAVDRYRVARRVRTLRIMKRSSVIWPRYYDVVILPPPPVRDLAIRLSQKLYKSGGEWKLGKISFIPHISIYHIPVLQTDFEPFTRRLQQAVDSVEFGTLET